MLSGFEEKVLIFARAERLFTGGDKVLVGVSGGADSVALLYTLLALKAERKIEPELVCVHLNHRLRGAESAGDEAFVVSQAARLGVDIVTRRLDVKQYAARHKLSIETAARKWRIDALREIAEQNGCGCIATGHHKDDNAETVIQRLLRGTGYRGLAGIRPKHRFENGACFIRPLLCVTRDEIESYLRRRGIGWRQDSSNQSLRFRRNFIRHRLIGEIQKSCREPVVELLWDLSKRCRRLDDCLRGYAGPLWQRLVRITGDKLSIDLPAFNKQHELVKVELVRQTLSRLGCGERDLTEGHFNRIIELANQNVSNRVLELPNGFIFWREYKKLVFAAPQKRIKNEKTIEQPVELSIPGRTCFANFVIEAAVTEYNKAGFDNFKTDKDGFVEWFDYDKLVLPLAVRFRCDGDRFNPLGMKAVKKVGQFLSDARVPHDIRSEVLIVSDAGKIVWVLPIRISDQTKISEETGKILELRIKQ